MRLGTAMKKAIDAFIKKKKDCAIRCVSFVDGTGKGVKVTKATFRVEYTKLDGSGYKESDEHPFVVTVFDLGCGSYDVYLRQDWGGAL